jgi:hypothetical protein
MREETPIQSLDQAGAMLDESRAERLLEGLYEQRNELGEVAEDLVELLLEAGVPFPDHLVPRRR